MTELTDRIRSELSDEWRTTREIADAAEVPGDLNSARSRVRGVLEALVRQGFAEMETRKPEVGHSVTWWRRKP